MDFIAFLIPFSVGALVTGPFLMLVAFVHGLLVGETFGGDRDSPVAGLGEGSEWELVTSADSSFGHWMNNLPDEEKPPEGERGPHDAPAGDNMSNLLKYALGLSPMTASAGAAPKLVLDEGRFAIELERSLDAAVNFELEGSADLETWTTMMIDQEIVLDHSDNRARIRFVGELSSGEHSRYFLRLRVNDFPLPPAPGEWELVFHDEFRGNSIDRSKWSESSSSLRDHGQGNSGQNNQIEWNTFDNLEVGDGILTMNARRETYVSPSGWEYPWTGSMINSSPGFTFTYAYIEERSRLSLTPGFWPAFWTWQAPGGMTQQEVDVYEYWSAWVAGRYLSTTHPWGGGKWIYYADYGTAADEWNVYGADIRPDGVTYYLNGVKVHQTMNAPSEPMNIISNLAVEENNPPSADHGIKEVDYIRAWKRKQEDGQNEPGRSLK